MDNMILKRLVASILALSLATNGNISLASSSVEDTPAPNKGEERDEEKKEGAAEVKEEEKEAIDLYLDRLDSLQPHLFDLIVYLVEHDNEPITIYGKGFLDSFELYGFLDYKQCKIKEEAISSVDPYKLEEKCNFKKGDYVTQFKLKEDVYHDLLIIKKKYKKLTRF